MKYPAIVFALVLACSGLFAATPAAAQDVPDILTGKTYTVPLSPAWADQVEAAIKHLDETRLDRSQVEAMIAEACETTVGAKATSGEMRSVATPAGEFQLGPGETLYSYQDPYSGQMVLLGDPVTVSVESIPAPIQQYRSGPYEIRTMTQPSGAIRGAIRSFTSPQTCRMVNGVRVCN